MFVKNSTETFIIPENAHFVSLPHTWNGQDGGNDYFRGSCIYYKTITKNDLPLNDLYFIEIQGANSSAKLYVNGKEIAQHHWCK